MPEVIIRRAADGYAVLEEPRTLVRRVMQRPATLPIPLPVRFAHGDERLDGARLFGELSSAASAAAVPLVLGPPASMPPADDDGEDGSEDEVPEGAPECRSAGASAMLAVLLGVLFHIVATGSALLLLTW